MLVAKIMLHRWEEPPISGVRGSGAVFFAHCNLRCVYCQNYRISQEYEEENFSDRDLRDTDCGEKTPGELAKIFLSLQSQGAHNINLVSPMHYAWQLVPALKAAKAAGLNIPVVYNTNSYEKIETLSLYNGLVDIYLPDLKYFDNSIAIKYSGINDYFPIASKAVAEMYRQAGDMSLDGNGIMKKGLIVRHLVLPGQRRDSMRILDWLSENLSGVTLSIMSQYLPVYKAAQFPEINRRLTGFEYSSVVDYAYSLGFTNSFVQQRTAASNVFIPDF